MEAECSLETFGEFLLDYRSRIPDGSILHLLELREDQFSAIPFLLLFESTAL
jgi:hypothetical protein